MQQNNLEPRIIGGMFGLAATMASCDTVPLFLSDRAIMMVNASSGLWLLIKQLSPSQVWLPSYLCGSMVEVVIKAGLQPKFYGVSSSLVSASQDWLEDVRSNDLVVGIDYFGFPMDRSWVAAARAKGAWILEDACQALLSKTVGADADFVLFSPRKFLGVPDGGILLCRKQLYGMDQLELVAPPSDWWVKALTASLLRREFDLLGENREWFKLFQEVEQNHPVGRYKMSVLSSHILKHGVDYQAIAEKRIENYLFLFQALQPLAILPTLPEGVVPLGFPIRVRNRDHIRLALFDAKIFPPVHWFIQEAVPGVFQDSHQLADQIMTLPIDQRYTIKDMSRIADTIKPLLRQQRM